MRLRFDRLKIMDEAKSVSLNKKSGKYGCFVLFELLFSAAVWYLTQMGMSLGMMVGSLFAKLCGAGGSDADSIRIIFLLLGTFAGTVTVLFWGKFVSGRSMRTYGFVKKNAVKHYFIGILTGLGMFSAAILICVATGACKVSFNPDGFSVFLLIALFIGFMVQGNEEEILCRGHVLVSVSRRYSVVTAIIVNSLIFGALHIFNSGLSVIGMINIILFGLFMSVVFIRTGNIWMVSAIHTMWNFAQGNIFGVFVSGNKMGETFLVTEAYGRMNIINGGDFGLEGGLAATCIITAAIIIAYFCKTSSGVTAEKEPQA